MLDLLEKSFLLGLGVLSVTKNTAEKLVNDAISKSKITPDEGTEFLKTFEDEGKKAKEAIQSTVEEILKTRIHSLMPCHKDILDLEARIKDLEAKVAELEGKKDQKQA